MAKVLIIEDDVLISRMYSQAFEADKFEVAVAGNGETGLKKAGEMVPDIILLDVMMPKMNGMEVLDALKKDEKLKKIPVVMLTNLAGTQDAAVAKKKGAADYLVKSKYKPREVVSRIKKMLGFT